MYTDVDGCVRFCINLKISAAEIGTWSPERIAAFFDGIAKVERAVNGILPSAPCEECGGINGEHTDDCEAMIDTAIVDCTREDF